MKSTATKIHYSHFVLLLGWVLIFFALILNIWAIEFFFVPDKTLEWPNTFYVFIFQILLGITGIIFLTVHANHNNLERYFYHTGLKKLALHTFLLLLFIDISLQVIFFLTLNHGELGLLHGLFHLNWEKNIPSTYSALQFLLAGLIALYCMKSTGSNQNQLQQGRYVWLFVAMLLFYLGVDEYFSFHEDAEVLLVKLNWIAADYDNELGGFGYAWTIVGGLFVVGIGIPLSFLFFKIFSRYHYLIYLLLLSGGVFVLGAIGMENFQVYIKAHSLNINGQYILMLEEFFEMLGVSIAIFVFICYIGEIKSQEINDLIG